MSSPSDSDSPPVERPFLRFHHSPELRTRTLTVLDAVDRDDAPADAATQLANLVVELTDAGLAAFFSVPLKAANVGFLIEQSANVGLWSASSVIAPAVRNVIGRMNPQQLRVVGAHIRGFMR